MAKKDFLTVKVSGLRELEIALNAIDLDLREKTLKKAGKEALEPVAERARVGAPRDTGGLRDTIKVTATTNVKRLAKMSKKRGTAMIASVYAGRTRVKPGSSGHQALQVEYGTSKSGAQPFMRPAINGKQKVVFMHFRKFLRRGIDDTAIKQARRNRRRK